MDSGLCLEPGLDLDCGLCLEPQLRVEQGLLLESQRALVADLRAGLYLHFRTGVNPSLGAQPIDVTHFS